MKPQFTDAVATALQNAVQRAQESRHTQVTENHLWIVFLQEKQGYFARLFHEIFPSSAPFVASLEKSLSQEATFETEQMPAISPSLQQVISKASLLAEKGNDSYVGSDHIFRALIESTKEPFASFKKQHPVSEKKIEDTLQRLRGSHMMDSPSAESKLQALDKYCTNLTKRAKEGK